MKLFIEVVDGPLKGARAPLKNGLRIGRKGPGLVLKDPRVSSFHAQVMYDESQGLWSIVDQDSTNGIKLEGRRLTSLNLVEGSRFQIGGSTLKIVAEKTPPRDASLVPGEARTMGSAWRHALVEYLRNSDLRLKELSTAVAPFQPALILEFIAGYQTGTVWTLGYGPRKIGKISPDLSILEPDAPDTSFEVSPSQMGILFSTEFSHKVLLNDQSITSEVLRDGDIITVFNSQLRVRFL